MKAANNIFHTEQSGHDSPSAAKHSKLSRVQYILGAVLVVFAYLLTSWITSTPIGSASNGASGFLVFWLGGGLITLALLTLAAKR